MLETLPFEAKLAARWPIERWQDVSVLVAVSGGADSVALLRALARLKTTGAGQLWVGHFNHRLRGADSDADERFVVELAQRLGLGCRLGREDVVTAAATQGDGIEAAAREARYRFLQEAAEELGTRYVVTAHTADDQAETILHRIVRGTGLAGLSGIPRVRPLGPATSLARPLLEARRMEVEAYLAALGQDFRQDATNRDPQYTRNRIRGELLPKLAADYNPGVVEALLRLGQLAGEAQEALEPRVAELYSTSVSSKGSSVVIDCRALAGQPRHLIREVLTLLWRNQQWPLQSMGFDQWQRLAELVAQPGDVAKQTLPGPISAQKTGERLWLARL